jgi:hypothetical protein
MAKASLFLLIFISLFLPICLPNFLKGPNSRIKFYQEPPRTAKASLSFLTNVLVSFQTYLLNLQTF